jgi:serine/threonine-protein kinase RsbW
MVDEKNEATFPGNYSSLVKIAEFIREAAHEAGFDDAVTYHIELAIDEAVTNIIEHAYGAEGIGDIEIDYVLNDAGLVIHLRDHGQPFQLDKVKSPDIKAPLSKRENHGLGVFIIHKLMDEVHYDFNQIRGNTVTLVKFKDNNS